MSLSIQSKSKQPDKKHHVEILH